MREIYSLPLLYRVLDGQSSRHSNTRCIQRLDSPPGIDEAPPNTSDAGHRIALPYLLKLIRKNRTNLYGF